MTIFQAERDHAAALFALQKVAYRRKAILYGDWTIPALTQTLNELREEFATKAFLVAQQNTVFIGSVRAELHETTCCIERLMVHPAWQRQGIGTRLMLAMETQFPQAERYEVSVWDRSLDNLRLCQRLGYRIFRRAPVSPQVTAIFMEKHRHEAPVSQPTRCAA